LGDEAVDFAAKAGLVLDPWQRMVLRDSMGVSQGGKWSAPQVGLLVPRQNGKGAVLEARELFGLFVLGEGLIIHSAHKFDTSQEHFLRMRNLIESNPDLDRHVKAIPTANGKEAIILRNGHRLKFKARTISGSGRGFSGDLLVLDEAMLLPEQALDAMLPTLVTRPNPQTWFTSSAGTSDSAALWRIVKRGRSGADRLAYFEWGCELGADVRDRANWAAANPGLGHRIPIQALEDDLEGMSEDGFAREHLGIWDAELGQSGAFDRQAWADCLVPGSAISGRVWLGLAVSIDRQFSAIVAAGKNGAERVHVEPTERSGASRAFDGRRLVEDAKRLSATHGATVVVDGKGPASSLIPDLQAAGVPLLVTSTDDVLDACAGVADLVSAGGVAHLGYPELDAAVAGAVRRSVGDRWAWGRRKSVVDISPLEAATLAVWGVGRAVDVSAHVW